MSELRVTIVEQAAAVAAEAGAPMVQVPVVRAVTADARQQAALERESRLAIAPNAPIVPAVLAPPLAPPLVAPGQTVTSVRLSGATSGLCARVTVLLRDPAAQKRIPETREILEMTESEHHVMTLLDTTIHWCLRTLRPQSLISQHGASSKR
jgi:hypothetical protein